MPAAVGGPAQTPDNGPLGARIASAAPDRPWQTLWSHGRPTTGHQVLTGHTGSVEAVAVGALPDGTRSSSAAMTTAWCGHSGWPTAPESE